MILRLPDHLLHAFNRRAGCIRHPVHEIEKRCDRDGFEYFFINYKAARDGRISRLFSRIIFPVSLSAFMARVTVTLCVPIRKLRSS